MRHPKKYNTTPEISKRMSNIGLRRNKPERLLAKALWKKGIRYRLNYTKLPGSPDIAITKHRIAVFVDGEFWHGKDFVLNKVKRNKEYWNEKIQENIDRDNRNDLLLRQLGWFPVHYWSKDIMVTVDSIVEEIEYIIRHFINT